MLLGGGGVEVVNNSATNEYRVCLPFFSGRFFWPVIYGAREIFKMADKLAYFRLGIEGMKIYYVYGSGYWWEF